MAEFKLDRFKYRWRNNWASGVEYLRDDIVRLNGKSWVCLIAHTSNTDFGADVNAILPGSNPPVPQPKWSVMTDGKAFVGSWTGGQSYYRGDIALNGGTLYLCTLTHVADSFENQLDNWTIFADHIAFKQDWEADTAYARGATVKYNGIVYRCITPHLAGSLLEDNINDWEFFHNGIEFAGAWAPDTSFRKNDLVRFGGSIFRTKVSHTSLSAFEEAKFDMELPGFNFESDWNETTEYQIGDVVRYRGTLWYAVSRNTGSDPYYGPGDSSDPWLELSYSYAFQGEWTINGVYRPGDIVQRGGNLYIALVDINGSGYDGSTLDLFSDNNLWELLSPGNKWEANWKADTEYELNDVVFFLGTAYYCTFPHVASNLNFPGDNGEDENYWEILIESATPAGLQERGDLLTYNLSRTITGDGSTVGATRVPIGSTAKVLSVDSDENVFWRNYINDAEVIYVATNGIDAPDRGTRAYRPFRTVRYAAKYVEDNFAPLTPVKIAVATGRYEEICPISVPAGCVVMGDELRSTTIEANSPLAEYALGRQYANSYLDHFMTYIGNIFANLPIPLTLGNNEEQVFLETATSGSMVTVLQGLVTDIKNYLSFQLASGNTNPSQVATNTLTSDQNRLSAVAHLQANKTYIEAETAAFMDIAFENLLMSLDNIKVDMHYFIRAMILDLQYEGNFYSLRAAREFANAVKGSQLEDMFYMRDVTGLRQMTCEGLVGALNPPGTFEVYQRPTGGAFASLDPGWGPADERTWINTRSPYLQGVTNIGTACIGQKIDGALHNGGNKSMVSNDFTQVLSDGIGAWVLNNGRAELVSVFTYYNVIGYFAENGGVIRATNGNNSYGKFGSIADGNDPLESPQNVTANTRVSDAVVPQVFAGTAGDEILAFEYAHCGEEYTSATAEVIGAGSGIDLEFDDFRDGAVYQYRILPSDGSGVPGGAGYTNVQGSAQSGTATAIRLASNDDGTTDEYNGQRIIIIAGTGTGQYGYIDSFDPITKDCDILRDSDGLAGWDHVVPGTPIESSLANDTVYKIEPRITAGHPGFSATAGNFPTGQNIIDITFGGTTQSYFNLTGTLGTGETLVDAQEEAAIFNVTRNGTTYSVVTVDPGQGYAVGDNVRILGTELGGTTPENDCILNVTAVTDDSFASIISYTVSGTGIAGKYVLIADPNVYYHSEDGETWTIGSLPSSSSWQKIINANNRFIAIAKGSNSVAISLDGESWFTRNVGVLADWRDIAYGNGRLVMVAENTNSVVTSTDGNTWTEVFIPDDLVGDSTASQWQAVTYGKGKFVAISSDDLGTATSTDGITWTRGDGSQQLPARSGYNWISFAYGNNRFVALSANGITAYSLDGFVWYQGPDMPDDGGGIPMTWTDMKYANGVFFAICKDPDGLATNFAATSQDGVLWSDRTLLGTREWDGIVYKDTWLAIGSNASANAINFVSTGARPILRAFVSRGAVAQIRILDPGSGFTITNLPTITVFDNSFSTEVDFDRRLGNGVLAQPSFVDRGIGYRVTSTTVDITGNGYADIIPEASTLVVSGVSVVPGPGVQIRITGVLDEDTEDPDDQKLFVGTIVTDLGDDGSGNGTRNVEFTITPRLESANNVTHGKAITLRERYSQCRISGHDFLDIGTGNFLETNYPDLYAGGAFFFAAPENEVFEINGGRVFYTSTDQDGNFRGGELFSVEQATGIVTISAEFFDLAGLSELSLGGVRLGGSGTVIREFSTDPNFTEDSNNIVPTQRAIITFLNNRLSAGGSEVETNLLTAGQVRVGGPNNEISTITGNYLQIPKPVLFKADEDTHLQGSILAQQMFVRTIDDGLNQ